MEEVEREKKNFHAKKKNVLFFSDLCGTLFSTKIKKCGNPVSFIAIGFLDSERGTLRESHTDNNAY